MVTTRMILSYEDHDDESDVISDDNDVYLVDSHDEYDYITEKKISWV